eukprot:gb/GEZN01010615.1/.p1 GENE.gb/GEZN01010615.1/~~gb/GEZN01010615.1/.p1  ORF type:complete len:237 (+),score=36.96 gb/GEZN01010615.1/:30-740(+)
MAMMPISDENGPGETQLQDLMIETGVIERPHKPRTDDDVHAYVQDKLDEIGLGGGKVVEEFAGGRGDSDEDLSDDEFFQAMRSKRLAQLKQQASAMKQAGVKTITKDEFEKEVGEEVGRPVVLLLYTDDGNRDCVLMQNILAKLAVKFLNIKFVKWAPGVDDIKNFPLEDCPTLMCYKQGQVIGQFATLQAFSGRETSENGVEWKLAQIGLLKTELSDDPSKQSVNVRKQFKITRK